jgi:hypothetical protein
LKQHGNEWRREYQCCGHLELSNIQQMTAPFAFGPVSDLIMILQVAEKRMR